MDILSIRISLLDFFESSARTLFEPNEEKKKKKKSEYDEVWRA